MNEEVVDLFHEVINITIIVVSNPREEVVDGFFQGIFEVRSKRLMIKETSENRGTSDTSLLQN